MFHRVMIPLDGSRRAEAAVPVAARLARASHGTVILVRCVEVPPSTIPPTPELAEFAPPPEPPRALMAEAADYLARIAAGDTLAGVKAVTRIVEGPAGENILAQSQQDRADLIVMCARGLKGYHRWKVDSVSQYIARHSQTPVLALNELTPHDPSRQITNATRALIPLDDSALSRAAIPPAIELMAALAPETGSLHLLRVISPFEGENLGAPLADLVAQAHQQLQRLVDTMREAPTEHLHLDVTYEVQVDTDPVAAILKAAQEAPDTVKNKRAQGYDLIMMATHGRTGLARWTLGSLTERVLQETRLPVLVVRPVLAQASSAPVKHV